MPSALREPCESVIDPIQPAPPVLRQRLGRRPLLHELTFASSCRHLLRQNHLSATSRIAHAVSVTARRLAPAFSIGAGAAFSLLSVSRGVFFCGQRSPTLT